VNDGPLTGKEIQYLTSTMKESIGDEVAECLLKEATVRASTLGDPETLDPTTVELLPVDQWSILDKSGKRMILTQVVLNQAIPLCTRGKVNNGPLSSEEIQDFSSKMNESIGNEVAECLLKEATVRASKLGDPETLDPTMVELLPVDQWSALGKSGRRTILTQVVLSQAIPTCTQGKGE
tara:strand:+ start:87 stop:623 length:537 start_codon:yes stop_codon:yes gene_type:complete